MRTLLLDANVLLALAWPNHPFHRRALGRIDLRGEVRWGTCLLTQVAFVRLSSNPAAIPGAKSPAAAGQMLQTMMQDADHVFLEARKSRQSQLGVLLQRCQGHNQVNDAFLIWLASIHGATVLTFDAPLRHLATEQDLVELIA